MFFPDIILARHLEFHEAWSSVEHARIQAQLFPQTGATSVPIHEGAAVFCGEKSPLSQVYGLGLSGPVRASDVEALMAADTLPDFRHQGIHTALMQVRLAAAAEAGCELAMVHGSPGGQSQGNILRSGFQLAYTSVALLRAL